MSKELGAYDVYDFGYWLGCLSSQVERKISAIGEIRSCLQPLCKYKTVEDLKSVSTEAQGQLSSLGKKYKTAEMKINNDDLADLSALVNNWFGRLDEISKRWILCRPQTHLDVKLLSLGAKSFFEEKQWNTLTELEKQGFDESASCLVTNNFTASEFMALRTVESVLRRWHEKTTGKAITNIFWGNILDTIENEYPEKTRPKEISPLFHLKRRRNEIAHPDEISSSTVAGITFSYAVEVCKGISKNL